MEIEWKKRKRIQRLFSIQSWAHERCTSPLSIPLRVALSTVDSFFLRSLGSLASSFASTVYLFYLSLILTTLRTRNVSFAFIGSVWFRIVLLLLLHRSRLTQIAFGNHLTNSLKIYMYKNGRKEEGEEKFRRRRTRLYKEYIRWFAYCYWKRIRLMMSQPLVRIIFECLTACSGVYVCG